MKKDAAVHEAEDAKKKEGIEAKNIAEQLIYASEKALKEAGEKVPADLRKSIEDKIADLKRAKDANPIDMAAVNTATEALSGEISKIGQYMNQQAGNNQAPNTNNQTGGNPGGNDGKGPEGDVKDAEFKEKK